MAEPTPKEQADRILAKCRDRGRASIADVEHLANLVGEQATELRGVPSPGEYGVAPDLVLNGGTVPVSQKRWRVIITDSESPSGFAVQCWDPEHPVVHGKKDEEGVYDCCDTPQIEVFDTELAQTIVYMLNGEFDRVPGALAWAHKRVEFHTERALKFAKDAKALRHDDVAKKWLMMANYMNRTLLTNAKCTLGAFDRRLPQFLERMKDV